MSVLLIFSNVTFPAYASAAVVIPFLKGLGYTAVGSAVGTAVSHLVEDWMNGDKKYYDSPGNNTTMDYYANNSAINKATGNISNSGANNENCYNTFSVENNRTLSIVKDSNNETLIYNPITNNYSIINNISYNKQYDTYYIENNEYNYYVTNNYTYVSYYIINNETDEESYYEIYYEMPDGRNSYDLEKEDIWGEYFIYNIANYELVPEDKGTTVALYHLDGDLKDSSYWVNNDGSGGSGLYYDSKFGKGYSISGDISSCRTNFYFKSSALEGLDINNFTVEFFMNVSINSSNISSCVPCFYDGDYYKFGSLSNGIYYIVIQKSNGVYTSYINGSKVSVVKLENHDGINNIPPMLTITPRYSLSFAKTGNNYPSGSASYPYYPEYIDYVLDEVRYSNKALYSGSFISIPSQPFDTNMVLAVPENPKEDMIAIRGNYEINNCRIGGVRPTYPVQGDVYIYLEDDVVKDIQQYEGDAWYSVIGAIYQDNEWHELSGFNLSSYTFEEESGDIGDDSGDNSGEDSGDNNDDSGGSGVGDLVGGIGKILDTLLSLIGKVMGIVADFTQSVLDLFSGFTTFTDGFSNFLSGAFGFIPAEIWNLVSVGLSLMVLLAVVKFLRK